ncbi:hypothetical protein BH20ACT2_BH20ACT2_19370 [soil metagenome]
MRPYLVAMPRPPARALAAVVAAVVLAMGCSGGGGSEEAFCAALPDVPPLSLVLDQLEALDREETQGALATTLERYAELDDAAPDEIDGDVATVTDLVTEIADALAVDAEDPVTAAERLTTIDPATDEVGAAADRIAVYASERCDIDLNPTTTSVAPPPPPPPPPSPEATPTTTG